MIITDLIPWRPKSRLPVQREDDETRSFDPAGMQPAPMPFDRMFAVGQAHNRQLIWKLGPVLTGPSSRKNLFQPLYDFHRAQELPKKSIPQPDFQM